MNLIDFIRKKFEKGEYAISDHAIVEGRKDGIAPKTVEKLERVATTGKMIEAYPDRERLLLLCELEEDALPVHIVVDYSEPEEPVFVTSYVPDRKHWIKNQIRKK